MKKETIKKSTGWFSKPIITDYYITTDGKKFTIEKEAIDWEWYLDNKEMVFKKYQFTEVSPYTLGLSFISNLLFSYKFHIENYSKEIENEISLYLKGLLKEHGNYNSKENIETIVKNHVKNKIDGWYVVVLNDHFGLLEIHSLNDLVTKIEND